jgi:pyridoxamine 5'-phosphate oxidase family protein
MGGDAVFTADEYRYLAARRDGRLVTIGAGDAPQIHPVSFRIDADGGAIEIGGPRIRDTQKYRNIRRDPRVSLIVDDETAPLQGSYAAGARGVQIRGTAELSERPPPAPGMGTDIILIRPVRIDAWNLAQPGHYSRFVT